MWARWASRSWLIRQENLIKITSFAYILFLFDYEDELQDLDHFNIFTCFIFFFIVKKCHTTISRFVPFLALQYLHNTLNIPVKRPFIPQHISTNQHLIFFYVLEHVSMRVEKWFFVLITWNSAILYLKCLPNVAKILTKQFLPYSVHK